MSLVDVSNNLTTFAWIPLILFCAIDDVSPRLCAVALTMSFLAGEPFFAAFGAVLFAIVIVRRRGVRDLINIAATSFALSAIQLLPFLTLALRSDRAHGGLSRERLLRDSMSLHDWMRSAIPPNLSGSAYDPRLQQHFIPIVYLGALTIFFAVIGIVVARQRAAGWLALISVCAVIAAGSYLEPVAWILTRLPISLFRYPARLVPLAALGICALAAFGCDRAIRSNRWQIAIAFVLFADVLVQIQPMLTTEPFNPHRVPYPLAIGRSSKIVRIHMTYDFDRDGWIAGYLNLYDRRFDAGTASPIMAQKYAAAYDAALTNHDVGALRAMSIGYVIAPDALGAFEPVTTVRNAVLQRNRGAFPLAYFRDDVSHQIFPVTSLAFTSSSAFVEVDAPSAGEVVLTQQAAPGWRVAIDGNSANPHESSLFRGVHVDRGHHSIKWTYRPLSLIVGAVLTFATLAHLLLSHMFVKRARRENFLRASLKIA
jgi:uncharacterized membrane protein YfhO